MAKLKERTKILSRDPSFSARLSVPAPENAPKAAEAPRTESTNTPKAPATRIVNDPGHSNHPAPAKEPNVAPAVKAEPRQSDGPGKAELTDQNTVTLRVSFRCPADLS